MKPYQLKTLIESENIQTILVDACGVLYNIGGMIPGSQDAWNSLKASGKQLILVTNNTSKSVPKISTDLQQMGFDICENDIISSGDSLSIDPKSQEILTGKTVYNYGWTLSEYYLKKAGAKISYTLGPEIDVIACMASSFNKDARIVHEIIEFLGHYPHTPIICANPDHYVWDQPELYPVIGYYANQIESITQIPIYWIGKPFSNFSAVLKSILKTRFDIIPDHSCCFFDDNPHNVIRIVQDLSIKGALVSETGLYQAPCIQENIATEAIPYIIPAWNLGLSQST